MYNSDCGTGKRRSTNSDPPGRAAQRFVEGSAWFGRGNSYQHFLYPRLIDFLAQPVGGLDKLQAIEVTETISVYMRVALLAGGILASPWIFYQFFSFLAKGLKPKERSNILIAVPFAVLFCRGRCFRVSGNAPIGTQFFQSVDGRADFFTDKVVFCVRHKPYLLDRDEL